MMPALNPLVFSNCWITSMLVEDGNDVNKIIDYLDSFNIETRPLWKPMHLQPFFNKYDFVGDFTSDKLFTHGICLPSDSKLSNDDIIFVTTKVIEYYASKK
jgi:dTDP-4-amino-4,6-dideoxygalactose transaminase